jgi:hypothetical protein
MKTSIEIIGQMIQEDPSFGNAKVDTTRRLESDPGGNKCAMVQISGAAMVLLQEKCLDEAIANLRQHSSPS